MSQKRLTSLAAGCPSLRRPFGSPAPSAPLLPARSATYTLRSWTRRSFDEPLRRPRETLRKLPETHRKLKKPSERVPDAARRLRNGFRKLPGWFGNARNRSCRPRSASRSAVRHYGSFRSVSGSFRRVSGSFRNVSPSFRRASGASTPAHEASAAPRPASAALPEAPSRLFVGLRPISRPPQRAANPPKRF